MPNPLTSLSGQLTELVSESAKSVVAIHARHRFASSGVHWTPGIIVTADHAIRRDEDINITAPNGATLSAELVGRYPGADLAVLRIENFDAPVAPRAENFDPQPGNLVLAVGRSKDSAIASMGLLGSISGPSSTWRGGYLDQVLRLSLDLHPGASGAAVVNAEGKLIGIATSVLSRVSVFAIPLATIDRVAGQLIKHGRIPRGYLGVGLQPIVLEEHPKQRQGLIVISVSADSPAARAGTVIGDILLELGDRATHSPDDVHMLLSSQSIGSKIRARILRGGEPKEIELTVGERPPK